MENNRYAELGKTVIWPQNAMPIRSTTPTPYDAKSAIFTMSKNFVTKSLNNKEQTVPAWQGHGEAAVK